MLINARENLSRAGLAAAVEFKLGDIRAGFAETEVDALFLDVKEPWSYLSHVKRALKQSGFFGAIVPTTNQVSELLTGLKKQGFGGIEVEENLLRSYKPVPGRLRPDDVMVGHTGYLIFARKVEAGTFPEYKPHKRVGR